MAGRVTHRATAQRDSSSRANIEAKAMLCLRQVSLARRQRTPHGNKALTPEEKRTRSRGPVCRATAGARERRHSVLEEPRAAFPAGVCHTVNDLSRGGWDASERGSSALIGWRRGARSHPRSPALHLPEGEGGRGTCVAYCEGGEGGGRSMGLSISTKNQCDTLEKEKERKKK